MTNNCVACSREKEVNMLPLISSSSLITTETQATTCENELRVGNEIVAENEVVVGNVTVVENEDKIWSF